jgi:2-oxoglutarate dehydrogenase E2 component (dihydrolipoamide succinyltransferase)
MANVEIVMPQMGESITEGTILKWHKKVGDQVKKDEVLLEISTDKVDSEIPSPASGLLVQITVEEQKTVPVRAVIGYIETDLSAAAGAEQTSAAPASATVTEAPAVTRVATAAPASEKRVSGRFYSPLVMSIAQAEGISMTELEAVTGTGANERVTKKDILAYLEARKAGASRPVAEPSTTPTRTSTSTLNIGTPVEIPELRKKYPAPAHEVLQMSNVLQKMAQHMVNSVRTSPHVAAVHEVDMTAIVRHRLEHAAQFEKNEGFKLTFTPYIVEAVVKAIKKYPLINSSVEGDMIIRKTYINLGLAVASENGLIVPVIKHAEEKGFVGFARAVNDLAVRTRNRKLSPEDIQGGTFTISNYGVFGTLIGTPIISQPQVAILGTGAITKRVAVLNDAIAIRSMAFFTLSFDHRIIDGALGGMFLDTVVKNLENFDTNMKF